MWILWFVLWTEGAPAVRAIPRAGYEIQHGTDPSAWATSVLGVGLRFRNLAFGAFPAVFGTASLLTNAVIPAIGIQEA